MNQFENYMSPGRKGHLIGIGGVSMSSLAEVLHGMGIIISGSDVNDSNPNVLSLRQKGIEVLIGHLPENIGEDVDFIVYVPPGVNLNLVMAEIERYKIADRTYKIITRQ